jgi:SAM-dependent methyltransferase
MTTYDRLGAAIRDEVVAALPPDYSFQGKRVLDFGCGAGRVLRHFAEEATDATFLGCDIDTEAIDWLNSNLSPPFEGFVNELGPPLPLEAANLDLIYATSVFTHITDQWSAWLLEMHRLLKPDGLLLATILNRGTFDWEAVDERWNEDETGMNVLHPWRNPLEGGPNVYHSEWWLRAHWGRLFEIIALQNDGLAFGAGSGSGQGYVLLRPKAVELTLDELEIDEPNEPRERAARRRNLRQLRIHTELLDAQKQIAEGLSLEKEQLARERRELLDTKDKLLRVIEGYDRSLSWRLTRPLRSLRRPLQRRRKGAQ